MKKLVIFISFLLFTLSFSGCAGFRFLKKDEKLLYKQTIRSGKIFDNYTLEELYFQQANVKFPPYAVIYNWGINHYDTAAITEEMRMVSEKFDRKILKAKREIKKERLRLKKRRKEEKLSTQLNEGTVLMQWGEPLAVFDSTKTIQNRDNIQRFLFNEGYFNASVDFGIKFKGRRKYKGKKVIVNYLVEENEPYLVDSVYLRSADSIILNLLETNREYSFLQEDENYRQVNFSKERERIEFFLKDHGFYNFSRQFVRYELDTTVGNEVNKKIAIRVTIDQPANGRHQQYEVDSVNFIIRPGYNTGQVAKPVGENRNGIQYQFYEDIFSSKMLNRRIFIRKDSLYSRSNTLRTQKQIANLDNFKFINVNYDSTGRSFTANIFTSPLDRYQWSHELGLNVTQGLPGPFYNLSFKKRNIFRGLENFEINGRFGIEGVAAPGSPDNFYQNRELGVNTSLTFPQFLLPVSTQMKDRIGRVNPRTRLQLGYTDIDRFDYRRRNINISNTFSWQNEKNTFFNFAITDLSVINTTRLTDDFRQQLESLNIRLINSFEPSFVSSMRFNMNKTVLNENPVAADRSSYYRVQLESGGTFLNFFGTEPLTDNNLEYFKYLKGEFDFSKTKPLSKVSSLAFRINVGLAVPYSDNRALPYEKYFFAGGSNGIRAWRPRRLGPGSFSPINEATQQVSYELEQQGEVLLQASVEFRRDLFGFIDYALFLDAGNIWLLRNDLNREGEDFQFNRFYKEIAVGSGLGLRFDFSFLIMRFDVGLKTFDPARKPGQRFILSPKFFEAPFNNNRQAELVVFNIGVGYPF